MLGRCSARTEPTAKEIDAQPRPKNRNLIMLGKRKRILRWYLFWGATGAPGIAVQTRFDRRLPRILDRQRPVPREACRDRRGVESSRRQLRTVRGRVPARTV